MFDQLQIYLDESGDLGFDFEKKGTPRYFIITLLTCNKESAIQIKAAVKRTLRNKIKSKEKELKGTTSELTFKKYFYHFITQSPNWHLYSIVLDKHKLKKKIKFLVPEHRIYNHLSNEILKQIDLSKVKSHLLLVADKRKGKRGINEFNKYLSYHLEATLPLNVSYSISHEQSHNNSILQAVDLFCWGIHRFYEYGDNAWLAMYQERLTLIDADDFLGIKKDGP